MPRAHDVFGHLVGGQAGAPGRTRTDGGPRRTARCGPGVPGPSTPAGRCPATTCWPPTPESPRRSCPCPAHVQRVGARYHHDRMRRVLHHINQILQILRVPKRPIQVQAQQRIRPTGPQVRQRLAQIRAVHPTLPTPVRQRDLPPLVRRQARILDHLPYVPTELGGAVPHPLDLIIQRRRDALVGQVHIFTLVRQPGQQDRSGPGRKFREGKRLRSWFYYVLESGMRQDHVGGALGAPGSVAVP